LLEYLTGDAAGQNMVTIATDAVCRYIEEHAPFKPQYWFVEGNMSGDKKASAQALQGVRGKKVVAEATLPELVVQKRLHCTPRQMANYCAVSALGGILSGSIGIQGHYANALAALYIACGQDAACVAESAVGITRFQETADGSLYVAVTLPNLIVGTVGGGTGLPSQKACLEILGLAGQGHANAFAEVCAALVLAGEVSIIAALASGQFAKAHQKLARVKEK
jgi:hydroxymethylglutaryl-CoA reductase (NADPH)